MKKIVIFLLILTLGSCKKEIPKKASNPEIVVDDKNKELYGYWVGNFVADSTQGDEEDFVYVNKINIVIKKIENNTVYGQSIVSGNSRNLKGTINDKNGLKEFVLNEPGDDKNDGRFEFVIENNKLTGSWFANDKKAGVLTRNFELIKQEFKYNPKAMLPNERDYVDYFSMKIDSTKEVIDDVEETYYDEYYRTASDVITKINASTTLLKEEDVKNLKKLELEILRNTIFARHGYTFKKKSYRQFFDPVDWYIPVSNDVTALITPIEKVNIKLLERFEKYADDNYDTFGR